MKFIPRWTLVSTLALVGASSVHAVEFSDNSIGWSYGNAYSNPGTNAGDVQRHILSFTHFSVDKLGTNLVVVEVLKSGSNEPATGGGGGAQEIYGFYSRDWLYGKITGNKLNAAGIRDIGLNTRFDFGTKNDAFAGRPRKLMVGPMISLDVPAGYLNLGVSAYKESNHNGIVGKDVSFDWTTRLGAAWKVGLSEAVAVDGFLELVGPKGRDGFGVETKTETLLRVRLMADTGLLFGKTKNGLLVGVGAEIWRNKFGADPAANPSGTTKQDTGLVAVEYHF